MTENKLLSSEPKLLVVSNNPFSDSSNNGKTLASFFENFKVENIAQLYFNAELPDNDRYKNYFQISDSDILNNLLFNKPCGRRVNSAATIRENKVRNSGLKELISKLKKCNIARMLRELMWTRNKWQTKELDIWLKEFSPDIVFFCAGDSGFAYEITKYVRNKFKCKTIIYITDDYILPRKSLSLFWWIRRNSIKKKMNIAIQESNLFVTISEKMQITYRNIFKKDSIVAVNMYEPIESTQPSNSNKNSMTFVYAGGLHFKRYKTLNLLAKCIQDYNRLGGEVKLYLKIYSTQILSNKILKLISIKDASEFCGKANSTELKKILSECDIPVHVESFDSKSIESTRLSISTKIPEYLSLMKPILVIGPKEIASIEYLQDCAYCITDISKICFGLSEFVEDKNMRYEFSKKALHKFNEKHNKFEQNEKIKGYIQNLYRNNREIVQ